MRECVQTLPVSLTLDAVTAVSHGDSNIHLIAAQEAIFKAAYAARDAHPKWELFTIEVEGVTLQMRRKDRPCARLVVTID